MRIALVFSIGALTLVGCALHRAPIFDPEIDASVEPPDVDMTVDAPVQEIDAGEIDAGRDAGDPRMDAGPECIGAERRCELETLVSCVEGRYERNDCASDGAYCDGTSCVPRACVPGSVACADATESRCDARGTAAVTTACTRGCSVGVGCNPQTACSMAIAATMGVGTMRVDTCGQGDDSMYTTPDCTRTDHTGSDLVVRLEVPVRDDYRIELRIVGSSDAVLYVRRACADATSEFVCNDDGATGFGSRIDVTLDPGDYFLMLDSFRDEEGPDGRCGEMDLVVTLR